MALQFKDRLSLDSPSADAIEARIDFYLRETGVSDRGDGLGKFIYIPNRLFGNSGNDPDQTLLYQVMSRYLKAGGYKSFQLISGYGVRLYVES